MKRRAESHFSKTNALAGSASGRSSLKSNLGSWKVFSGNQWLRSTKSKVPVSKIARVSTCWKIEKTDCRMFGTYHRIQGKAVKSEGNAKISSCVVERHRKRSGAAMCPGTARMRSGDTLSWRYSWPACWRRSKFWRRNLEWNEFQLNHIEYTVRIPIRHNALLESALSETQGFWNFIVSYRSKNTR